MAGQISSDYSEDAPVFIGVLNGAVFFFSDLLREVTIPAKIDFIRAASYGADRESSGSVNLLKDIEIPIKERDVIVVEDILDTGRTLKKVIEILKVREPRSIKTCVLINKMERREIEIDADYCGFQVDEGFLVGYGLDYNEQYRCLPEIYTLK